VLANDVYSIGETVTAVWDPAGNSDVASVSFDFSDFGGGASVAAALASTGDNAGKWVATYTLVAGSVDDADNVVRVTVTDTAGNTTGPVTDDTQATVDIFVATISANTNATNLSLYSEDIGNSAFWSSNNSLTVQVNQVLAPDGSMSAEKLTATATAGKHFLIQDVDGAVEGTYYTSSMYIKPSGGMTHLQVLESGLYTGAFVNLDTHQITFSGTQDNRTLTDVSVTVTDANNGWKRIALTWKANALNLNALTTQWVVTGPGGVGDVNAVTGDGERGFFAWGAQLETGRVATAYVPTTTAAASADMILTSRELADGLVVKVDASNAKAGDKIEIGYLDGGAFTSFGTPQFSAELAGADATASITLRDLDGTLLPPDGALTLATRLIDNQGNLGAHTSLGSYTISTAVGSLVGVTPEVTFTNLYRGSHDLYPFSGGWQTSNLTSVVNVGVTKAPDGSERTVDLLIADTTSGSHNFTQTFSNLTAGQDYTATFYVKAAGNQRSISIAESGAFQSAQYHLDTGRVVFNPSERLPNATLLELDNGWYRLTFTYNALNANARPIVSLRGSDGSATFAGTGNDGIYVWGAQLEAGTVSTALIATTTASAASSDAVWTAAELAAGVSVKVDASSAVAGDRVELGYLENGAFTSFTQPIYSVNLNGPMDEVVISVQDDATRNIPNGTYQIATRLVNAQGEVGVASNGVAVQVSTSAPGSLSGVTPKVDLAQLHLHTDAAGSWTTKTRVTTSDNQTLAPDGTLTADLVLETADTGSHLISTPPALLTVSQIYTTSYYLKAYGDTTTLRLTESVTSKHITVDVKNLTLTSNDSNVITGTVTDEGNGWFRVSAVYTAATTNHRISVQMIKGLSSYAGDVTDGFYVWGAQTVQGAGVNAYVPSAANSVTSDTILNANELANGFTLQVDVTNAVAGDRVEVGYLSNGSFTAFTSPSYSGTLAGTESVVNVVVDGASQWVDGDYTLVARLVNQLGEGGEPTAAGVSVTVDTASAQTINDIGSASHSIRGGIGDDTIAGNGGNDTIDISQGGADTLKYNLLSTTDVRFGNGLDTVNGFATNKDATLDAGEDKIDLTAIIAQMETDLAMTIDVSNLTSYLTATSSGGNTTVFLDRDGEGSTYAATALVNLQGVSFATSDLANMVSAGQICIFPVIHIDSILEIDNKINIFEIRTVIVEGVSSGVEAGQLVTVSITDGLRTIEKTAAVQKNGKWRLQSDQWADVSSLLDGTITITADVRNVNGKAAFQAMKSMQLERDIGELSGISIQAESNQLDANDLTQGVLLSIDLTGVSLENAKSLRIVNDRGFVYAYNNHPIAGVNELLLNNKNHVLPDGLSVLYAELIDDYGNSSKTQAFSLMLNTNLSEFIGATSGVNNVIRGGGGNDTVDLTTGGQDSLVFNVIEGEEADVTGGNGSDNIIGFDFELGIDRDKLILDRLLTGYSATGNMQADAQALEVYIDLVQNGDNLELWIDRDGAVATHSAALLATFMTTTFSSMNGATTEHEALEFLLVNSILEIPKVPLYFLAGQSNAWYMSHNFGEDSFHARVTDKFESVITDFTAVGSTSIFKDSEELDWYPYEDYDNSSGELFEQMISKITNHIENNNAYLAGVFWIQGEADAGNPADYGDYLYKLISTLNNNFGEDYNFSLALLSDQASRNETVVGWSELRNIQINMKNSFRNVDIIDPYEAFLDKNDDQNLSFYLADGLHYSEPARVAILDAYLSNPNNYPIGF
jgi:hypothetical protein